MTSGPVTTGTSITASSSSTGGMTCGASGQACCTDAGCQAGLTCDGTTCGPAVSAFTCPPGAPQAVYVAEDAPPAKLAPWDHAFASVTYANCGTTTWTAVAANAPTGVKLGPSSPHDSTTWTPSRLVLPADVPPGNKVKIAIPIHAPPLTGNHPYAYELVNEGVAWLGSASPMHTIDVEAAASAPIQLCPGVMADPSGMTDATAALQACIDMASGTLSLAPGIYRVSGIVHVDKSLSITSTGAASAVAACIAYDAPKCAVLRADATTLPSGGNTRGFLRLGELNAPVSMVTLNHVLVDGNRGARLGSTAAMHCAAGQNGDGINIGANCTSCEMLGMASARALCGSGLEWDGDGITVKESVFFGNGDHNTQNMWSDGLTIHKSDNAFVGSSMFVDNSDVGFISGGGVNASFIDNYAAQITQTSFAAMMLDNFNSPALGNFTGASLKNNTVVCPAGCHFGIELGPHPWYQSPNIQGGTVSGNTVVGANIEINAQGAGTAANPTVIAGNNLGPTPSSAMFQCGNVSGLSPLNVSAESHVDLQGGTATGSISVPCP